jgi:tetraprenyl-beta-curcumene synthase
LLTEIRWAVRHVLASSDRRRFLLRGGPGTTFNLLRFFRTVVPRAARVLAKIERQAQRIPDNRLRHEALSSVRNKAYHVAGGCILGTFLSSDARDRYVDIVVPLESIYDYLDNLCDRHPEVATEAYPVLHGALHDALDPHATPRDYYARGPSGDDGGYLSTLVRATQDGLRRVAGYELLLPMFREAATFYTDLQTFKHLAADEREKACVAWYERHRDRFAALEWYEFASAAGSQFQVYVPLYLLVADRPDAAHAGYDAYFPTVAAVHVLLDAFIDRDEDREHGELNLAGCYASAECMCDRMGMLAARSYDLFAALPQPRQHRFLFRAMSLFYLTHPKVYAQGLDAPAVRLLKALGQ